MAALKRTTGSLVRTVLLGALVAVVFAAWADARELASPRAPAEPRRCVWSAYGGAAGRSFTPPCPPPRGAGLARPRGAVFRATGAVVTAAPVLDGEVAYVGDWAGRVRALDLRSGGVRWTFSAGRAPIVSSGSLARAGRERLLLVASAGTVYALRAVDGALVWKRRLGAAVRTESSPTVAGGSVLVGTSARARAGERAGVWALSVRDGSVVWRFDPEAGRSPAGCGDVQTSPTVDLARGAVYVGTAECARSGGFGSFAEAIVALDLRTGRARWSFQPERASGRDVTFTGKPALLRGRNGSVLVGLGSRDGCYYAVDSRNGRLAWRQVVADAGPRGGAVGGLVAPAAADDRRLYLTSAAGHGPYLTALDAASGRVLWRNGDVGPSFAPPVSLGRVIVTADAGGVLRGIDARTGRTLWLRAARAPLTAAVAVAGRRLVTATGFQIPGAAQNDPANGILVYRLR